VVKTGEKIREELQEAIQRDEKEYYERKRKSPNKRIHRSHKHFNHLGRIRYVQVEDLDKELSRISDLVNHALLFLDGSEIQEKCEKDYNVMVEILTDLRSTIEQIRRELKDE